jgi:hypothetical protein
LNDYTNYSNPLAKHIINNLIFLILFCATISYAQLQSVIVNNSVDTLNSHDNSIVDTSKFQMKKSAWGAVLRSTLLPGLGQFYNESYWKIPIIWGTLGYLGYQWNVCNNFYKQYRDLYSANGNPNNAQNDPYFRYREHYRDQRDMFAVFIGLTFFLNLVDAYVDAQLFDFDVTNDMNTNTMQLSMRVRF